MTTTPQKQVRAAQCDEHVVTPGEWRSHVCGRPVYEAGKCKIHCASAVKARADKSQAAWVAKQANSPYAAIGRLQAEREALREQVRALSAALVDAARAASDSADARTRHASWLTNHRAALSLAAAESPELVP